MTIRVVEPGAFTTVQDLGRLGWASSGVPPSGAMDALSFRAANLLAGNTEHAAALEATMIGPLLEFTDAAVVALVGAPFDAEVDGGVVRSNESLRVERGSFLRLGKARSGCRAYLAIRGGIDVPPVLGSRSTYAAGGIGGPNGRALAARDFLRIGAEPRQDPMRRLVGGALSSAGSVVRAVPGPQEEAFGSSAFWGLEFRVSPRSDRAGVRLEGEPVEHIGDPDIDPEGVVTGAIQVPGDGMPIVLGPDRPATGGYAKIATVITADLPLMAQARPGDTLSFVPVDVEQARAAWDEQRQALIERIEDLA